MTRENKTLLGLAFIGVIGAIIWKRNKSKLNNQGAPVKSDTQKIYVSSNPIPDGYSFNIQTQINMGCVYTMEMPSVGTAWIYKKDSCGRKEFKII